MVFSAGIAIPNSHHTEATEDKGLINILATELKAHYYAEDRYMDLPKISLSLSPCVSPSLSQCCIDPLSWRQNHNLPMVQCFSAPWSSPLPASLNIRERERDRVSTPMGFTRVMLVPLLSLCNRLTLCETDLQHTSHAIKILNML